MRTEEVPNALQAPFLKHCRPQHKAARGHWPFCWKSGTHVIPVLICQRKKKSLAERDFQAARCRLPTRAGMPSWQDLLVPTGAKGWVPEWVRAALRSCTVFSQSLLREFKRCFALAANTVGFSQTKSKKCAEIDPTMLGRGQAVRPAVPSGPQLCESVKIRKVS